MDNSNHIPFRLFVQVIKTQNSCLVERYEAFESRFKKINNGCTLLKAYKPDNSK